MPPTWKFQMKLEYNKRPANVYPFHGTFLYWKAKLFFHMSQFFPTFFLFVNSGLLLATKRCCILSLLVTFSTFWLRQELRESQCWSVHSSVRLFICLFVFLFICPFLGSNLSRALILHLSSSNLQAIIQQSVSSQSVSVSIPLEPKILRLVNFKNS